MAKCVKTETTGVRKLVPGSYDLSNSSRYWIRDTGYGDESGSVVELFFGIADDWEQAQELSWFMRPNALRELADELIGIADFLEDQG